MKVSELIEALSALDPELPVQIRETGGVPQDIYPPFERRSDSMGWTDHVLLQVEHP